MKLLIFTLLFLSQISCAQTVKTCGEAKKPASYKYCITKDEKSSNRDVLYYFHGGGGSEREWAGVSKGIYQHWDKIGHQAPVVITISAGRFWLLVEKNTLPQSGFLETFKNYIMPDLELLALGQKAKRRMIFGASMGGFNTARAIMELPANTFSRAAMFCPAFINLSPWASEAAAKAFVEKSGANLRTIQTVSQIVKMFVPNEKYWFEKVSPLDNFISIVADRGPKIFVATNEDDKTFVGGGKLFAERVKSSGADILVREWPGGHCFLNAVEVAEFLR